MTFLGILKLVGIAGLIVFIVGMFGFVKVPTDKVCYISGFRKRKVTGRIGFFFVGLKEWIILIYLFFQ